MSQTTDNTRHRGQMGRAQMGARMAGRTEKAADFKGTWVKLARYCRTFIPAVIVALVAAAGGTVLQVIGPDKLKDMANQIAKGLPTLVDGAMVPGQIDLNAVVGLAWVLVAIYAASSLFSFVQSYIMATVTQRVSKSLRADISAKINRLPLKYFDKTSNGDVMSRVTNDVDAIGQTLNQSLATMVTAVVMFIGSLIMMFYNSWVMALTAIGASLLGFAAMTIIMKHTQKYFLAQQNGLGAVQGQVEEIYSNLPVVKAYNGTAAATATFERHNDALFESAWKSQFLSGLMMPLMQFVGNFGYVAVCVVGAALALNGQISFGVIVAFMVYVRLFTQPLSQLAQAASSLQRTAAAGERVFGFLGEPELASESGKTASLVGIAGDVVFDHVSFGYVPDHMVINDFSAHIAPGQKVAIVGPTGAGKTTIVNLLMRFYELDAGQIRIDDVPTTQVPRENVHEQFGMVLQDAWLFGDTIKANIVYAKTGITDEQVIQAARLVGLDRFIMALPQGYDTVLGDQVSLSEGQKQLITIARAMIQDAPLLILDEATSSVDTRTERAVQVAMDALTRGRTSFVIAHRLSTIRNADLILVMNDGEIVESGTHQQLLDAGGFYADLYNSQFEQLEANV